MDGWVHALITRDQSRRELVVSAQRALFWSMLEGSGGAGKMK